MAIPINPAAKVSLPPEKLDPYVRDATTTSYVEIILRETNDYHSFLDTSLSLMLYDPPILTGNHNSNFSIYWVMDPLVSATQGDAPSTKSSDLNVSNPVIGPYQISNYITKNSGFAFLNVGATVSTTPPIFELKFEGSATPFYLQYDPSRQLYAIYTPTSNPSVNAYLMPYNDVTQLGARGKMINAYINPTDPYKFVVRSLQDPCQ